MSRENKSNNKEESNKEDSSKAESNKDIKAKVDKYKPMEIDPKTDIVYLENSKYNSKEKES